MRSKIAEDGGRSLRDEILGFEIQLNTDQEVDVKYLWDSVDVLAVLPNSFSKSLIFQAFVMASKMASNDHTAALDITRLKSIPEDLMSEANGPGQIGSEF